MIFRLELGDECQVEGCQGRRLPGISVTGMNGRVHPFKWNTFADMTFHTEYFILGWVVNITRRRGYDSDFS